MQSSGQYGVTEVPQFVVGGSQQHPSQAHIFSLAHDHMSLSPPTSGHGHHHPGQQQQHLYSHHQQQQVVAPKEPQQSLHHLHAHQQSQASSHSPHQQRQQHQHMQQQQQHHHHHHHQQQQTSVQHQHQMVHQLGLGGGGPDSPEAAAASPSPPVASSRPSPPTNTGFAKQMISAAAGMSLQAQQLGHEAAAADDDGNMELGEEGRSTGGGGGNRWPRQETLLLIQIRSEMDSNFRDSGLKGPLWEDVARKLAELGYHRSAKKCKEKFENIHKYYKKTKDGKAGRQDGKNYRFFSELDALYSGRRNNVVGASTRDADHATAATTLLLPAGGGRGLDHMGAPSAFRAAAAAAEEENNNVAAVSDSSQENHNEAEGGDEDEDDEDEDEDDNTTRSKKRFKRSSKDSDHGDLHARTSSSSSKKKVMLLESLVKKLMDKQEAMQRKFLESMEKREHDRIAREEAWKRQEMERMTREHELRIQQHTLAATRDAALIAVLQKVTGQTLQLPQIPEPHPPHPSSPPSPPPLPVQQQQQHTTTAIQPRKHRIHQQLQHPQDVEPGDGKDGFDLHSKRWPTPEVHALIRLRMEMESRFQETGAKGPLWEEISRGMSSMGYSFRNAKRCKEKWENVNKYYRKTKESNKKRAENSKTCPYFHQLEALYHNAGSLHGGSKLPPRASSKVTHEGAQSQDVALQLPPAAPGLQQDHRDHHDQSCGREALVQDSVNTEVMQLPASAAGAADGSGSASNGAATAHLFSSPENGSSGDPGGSGISITKKALQGRTSR